MCLQGQAGHATQMPVFVVGMPRSGSTLVEQMLASHSRVYGAGEPCVNGSVPERCVRLGSRV